MRIFDVREHFQPDFGECVIGSRQTGRHGVYLAVGEVSAGEVREMKLEGHEEILMLLSGEAFLEQEGTREPLRPEQAVYLPSGTRLRFRAATDCRYVSAGGHPPGPGHSHGE